jgi:hypothetical protein
VGKEEEVRQSSHCLSLSVPSFLSPRYLILLSILFSHIISIPSHLSSLLTLQQLQHDPQPHEQVDMGSLCTPWNLARVPPLSVPCSCTCLYLSIPICAGGKNGVFEIGYHLEGIECVQGVSQLDF